MSLDTTDRIILLDTYVQDFWLKKDKRLSRVLRVMDNVEFWVLEDEESFSGAVTKLGACINEATKEQLELVLDKIIMIMAYMSSSKAVRLASWLEENHPDVFQKILAKIPTHEMPKAAKLMGTRLRVLQSLNLTGKIFSPARSQKINMWLRSQAPQESN